MLARFRPRLNHATVVAYLALFIALGGGAYAAIKLPKNSVGAKQIRRSAVNSSKIADGSLRAGDFKAGQLPAGPQGLKGDKGDPCPASDANCKGPKGDTGARGPGTQSFDGQFDNDVNYHSITTINGMDISIYCGNAGNTAVALKVERVDTAHTFHGFGTQWTGTALQHSQVFYDGSDPAGISVIGDGTAELHLVARAPGPEQSAGYTHIDVNGIIGTRCNYHVLLIPPS